MPAIFCSPPSAFRTSAITDGGLGVGLRLRLRVGREVGGDNECQRRDALPAVIPHGWHVLMSYESLSPCLI